MSRRSWHMSPLTKINTVLVVGHSMYQSHSSTGVDHSLFQKINTFSVFNRLFGTKFLMLKEKEGYGLKSYIINTIHSLRVMLKSKLE